MDTINNPLNWNYSPTIIVIPEGFTGLVEFPDGRREEWKGGHLLERPPSASYMGFGLCRRCSEPLVGIEEGRDICQRCWYAERDGVYVVDDVAFVYYPKGG